MKLAPYPSYRTSEVMWAGSLPASWRIARLRHIGQVNPSASEANRYSSEVPVSFFPMEAVGDDGTVDLSRERPLGELQGSYSYFRDGDVAIAKVTPCFENGKGAVMSGLANGIGFGSSELTNIRLVRELDPRLFYYYMRTPEVRGLGAASMYGAGGLKRIPDDFFRDFKVPIPSSEEQVAIIAFVDRETAKLDTLTAKQERLIELLQEKRQAVISHAVTKGLDPKVPMKDSGVDWLGKVPAHWDVTRLRFLCHVQTGDKDTVDAQEDGAYPFFVRSQTVERINSYTFDGEAVLTAGDGVGVGKVFHYYLGKLDFHQRVYLLSHFRRAVGLFLFHVLKENFYKVALEGNAKSTVDSLRMPLFLNFPVPVPPKQEQERILGHISKIERQIEKLVAKAQRSIGLMREHRSALISAAVTGKIDVRQALPEASHCESV